MDGTLAEWGPRLTALNNAPASMAALPTDSLLYVAVLVRDQTLVRTIVERGLIIWVDPAGGTDRTYGVQYPMGLRRQQAGQSSPQSSPQDLDAVSLDELEVLRGDTLRTRVPARFSSGLRGAATLNSGALICEVALPVGPNAPSSHQIAASLGQTVGLGLETPSPDASPEPEMPESDIAPSGRNERRPPQPEQRDRQPPTPPPSDQQPTLNQWVTLRTGV